MPRNARVPRQHCVPEVRTYSALRHQRQASRVIPQRGSYPLEALLALSQLFSLPAVFATDLQHPSSTSDRSELSTCSLRPEDLLARVNRAIAINHGARISNPLLKTAGHRFAIPHASDEIRQLLIPGVIGGQSLIASRTINREPLLFCQLAHRGAGPPALLGRTFAHLCHVFSVKEPFAERNLDGPPVTHNLLIEIVVSIAENRTPHHLLTARILKDRLSVVASLAPIFPVVDAACANHRDGFGTDCPVGHIDLVRGEFGHETTRVFPIHSPVDQPLVLAVGHRPAPIIVAVPLGSDEHHPANCACEDHVHSALIEGIRAPL